MTHRFPAWLLLPVLCANGLHAQIDTAQARVKHLMEQVDTEMKEIDRLLLTGAGRGAAAGAQTAAERSSKKLSELLLQARKSQDSAGENIKKLIEELEKLSQQNQQQQQQQDDQQNQDDQQKSQGQQQDRQRQQQQQQQGDQQRQQQQAGVQTPDMVKQQQEEQQRQQQHQGQKPEQQKQPKDGEQPTGPDQNPTTGQNKVGGKPPQAGEEQVPRGVDSQRWGVLPKYLEFMHARGSLPEVPERYRRLYEAYLKSGQKPPTPDPRK